MRDALDIQNHVVELFPDLYRFFGLRVADAVVERSLISHLDMYAMTDEVAVSGPFGEHSWLQSLANNGYVEVEGSKLKVTRKGLARLRELTSYLEGLSVVGAEDTRLPGLT